jgi:hypothetical protein
MLLLTHERHVRTKVLVDIRWGVNIYLDSEGYYLAGHRIEKSLDRCIASLRIANQQQPDHIVKPNYRALAMQKVKDANDLKSMMRNSEFRSLVREAAAAGKSYTQKLDEWAKRATQREAISFMATRLRRAIDRKHSARTRPGRILELYKEKMEKLEMERQERVKSAVSSAYWKCGYCTATAGTHSLNIIISPSYVDASGESSKGESYSRKCTWRKRNSHHTIKVLDSWIDTVLDQGIAVADGMLTLMATQVGENVYEACWVRQGRGFGLEKERGYIATDRQGNYYHSTTSAEAAERGLRRKLAAQARSPEQVAAIRDERKRKAEERKAYQINNLINRMHRYDLKDIGHVVVGRDDSLRAGNCIPGTDEFIQRVSKAMGKERTSATISEIVGVIASRPQDAARLATEQTGRQFLAACLIAIRRDKQARRALLNS